MRELNSPPAHLLEIDGRMLRTFLAVLETGSVTAAAGRLGLTQSAVSHSLERLRELLGDPLFVKSGRGIAATSRAEALAPAVRQMLRDLERLGRPARFAPQDTELIVTVAANDFQRDLLLPALQRRLAARLKDFRLIVIPSRAPTAELLREGRCDLIITPRPPEASDLLQKRLLTDRYVCFFDSGERGAPATLAEYLAARHVTVAYEDGRRLEFDELLEDRGLSRAMGVAVPNFGGIAAFLRGTDMLASLPSLLRLGALAGFGMAALPLSAPEVSMYAVWHRRHHEDPAHAWLRAELEEVADGILDARVG
ncbi:MAG TPA: LysR family transcriptional regulator [Steroidobacteraceae bacterium]|nr:LysR family transcriptional regulator [Steroidobacteraceae bacterium]